jgi:NitT/TauT family transport system substrate-binding protein
VKKFSNALLKGLQDTYSDPAAAAAILKKYVPNTDVDVATKELEIMREYIKPPGFNGPLGEVTQERVQKVISLLEESKAIGAGALKPEDLVTLSLAPKS